MKSAYIIYLYFFEIIVNYEFLIKQELKLKIYKNQKY
jgi:hypothetical protein